MLWHAFVGTIGCWLDLRVLIGLPAGLGASMNTDEMFVAREG